MDYFTIIYGAIGGVGWSLLGFAREKEKNAKVTFDSKKFVKTIIVGAIVGAAAGFYGMEFEAITAMAMYGSITAVADKIVNIIWGFFKK